MQLEVINYVKNELHFLLIKGFTKSTLMSSKEVHTGSYWQILSSFSKSLTKHNIVPIEQGPLYPIRNHIITLALKDVWYVKHYIRQNICFTKNREKIVLIYETVHKYYSVDNNKTQVVVRHVSYSTWFLILYSPSTFYSAKFLDILLMC